MRLDMRVLLLTVFDRRNRGAEAARLFFFILGTRWARFTVSRSTAHGGMVEYFFDCLTLRFEGAVFGLRFLRPLLDIHACPPFREGDINFR